jgi:hypothetical protein
MALLRKEQVQEEEVALSHAAGLSTHNNYSLNTANVSHGSDP